VPIFLAAEGPRSTTLAGRVADGVFLGTGLTAAALDTAAWWLSAGSADRDAGLGQLEVWHMARLGIADERGAAIHALRPALASIAHHGLSSSLERKGVPGRLVPALEELRRRYDTRHHVEPGESPNARLVDELGLTDYLVDRFAVVGTPDDCARKVIALRDAGVANILFTITDADPAGTLRRWQAQVAPRLEALAGPG
jgi:5,10-methylenetetrahydromethanopterin reductase